MLEAPALARIQSEYRDRNLEVIAVNLLSSAPLEVWESYWRKLGGGEVIYAQDASRQAARALRVQSAGATVIIASTGRVAYRDRRATPYETLRAAVEGAL